MPREVATESALAASPEERNARYEELLRMPADTFGEGADVEHSIAAQLVLDSGGPFMRTLVANAGEAHGVHVGFIAVNENGLIGRVVSVGQRSSRVLMLDDYNSRIPVMGEASRVRAVLAGQAPGQAGMPEFELADFSLPAQLPVSVPSELARRRPDVRASEALLQAKRSSRRQLGNELAELLPRRLAEAWLASRPGWAAKPVAEMRDQDLRDLARQAQRWEIVPDGTEGYRKAEVTLGGVDARELSSQSMESKLAPGLHFIGEVVDVTGWLGGYNFQWAWASAAACARAVAERPPESAH